MGGSTHPINAYIPPPFFYERSKKMDTEKKISELFAIIKRLLSIIYSNGLAVDELTSKMMQDL